MTRAIRRRQLRDAVREAKRNAKSRGCTCSPDHVAMETGKRHPRHAVNLKHWPDCALLRSHEGPGEPLIVTYLKDGER